MNYDDKIELADMTTEIVSAYVGAHQVSPQEMLDLIESVYGALSGLASGAARREVSELVPAVSVKKSVTADYIICLEDGKRFKSLKRHLRTRYSMSPEDYRQKWGLPHDYPMVAPNYAKSRSELAKKMGLGTVRRGESEAA